MRQAKRTGFSDQRIAELLGSTENERSPRQTQSRWHHPKPTSA
ncbi:MAG: hypothetical protein U0Y68_24385 [Blastocatellia bacterium]